MRIFHNDIEITKEVEKLDSTSYQLTYTPGDYLYIASDFPFNHFYLAMGATKNLVSDAIMSIEYGGNNGTAWIPMVEVRDETNALANSGHITFTPNRNNGWPSIVDSQQFVGISKVVYYKYWLRISFDKTLTSAINISFIGNKFSDDSDLFNEFPMFDDANFLTAFKAGKTSWDEQHVRAAEVIISDLQKKGVILGAEQILDKKRFLGASICKVAEILYTAFGSDYVEQKKSAREEYGARLNLSQFDVDMNGNAIEEPAEVAATQGWLSR
jgi:hypothetical protein